MRGACNASMPQAGDSARVSVPRGTFACSFHEQHILLAMPAPDLILPGDYFRPRWCVYALIRDGCYLYVGCSKNHIAQRFYSHHAIHRIEPTDTISIWYASNESDARRLEASLIAQHRPEWNREGAKARFSWAEWTRTSSQRRERDSVASSSGRPLKT